MEYFSASVMLKSLEYIFIKNICIGKSYVKTTGVWQESSNLESSELQSDVFL